MPKKPPKKEAPAKPRAAKVNLSGRDFDSVMKAMLGTPPPKTGKREKVR